MSSASRVTAEQFDAFDGVDDWRYLLGAITAEFRVGGFGESASLAAEIGAAADEANHHPAVDLRYPDHVRVTFTTQVAGGLTDLDVTMARRVSALAAAAGARAEPLATQSLEIALDTMDADRIRPFWAAVLRYEEDEDGALVDPLRIGPPLWFQQMDRPRTQRNRFHLDVTVPHDVAEQRVAATLAAGGRLVEDRRARAFWVLADADGNEACVCTWQDR